MKSKLSAALKLLSCTFTGPGGDRASVHSSDAHREDIFQFGDGMGLTSMTVLPCASLFSSEPAIIELHDMQPHLRGA